jgi:PEP-CTERM putative exosortase interaction domain
MKSKLLKSVLAAVAAVGLLTGSAMAAPLHYEFTGDTATIAGNGDGTGTIYFGGMTIAGSSSADPYIGLTTSGFGFEYTVGATVSSPYGNMTPVAFTPPTVDFYIYDGGATILTAKLTIPQMITLGSMGGGNLELAVNFTDIWVDAAYLDSPVMNALFQNEEGIFTLSAEYAGTQLINVFNGNGTETVSYSASLTPVPEPATMLLFGVGLLGLAGIARRKNS